MPRGALLGIATLLIALFVVVSPSGGTGVVRIDSFSLQRAPTPRVAARAAVAWCGLGEPVVADRKPEADVSSQRQVHVTYAIPADAPGRFTALASPIASDIEAMDGWWRREDAARTIRFDLFAFPGCTTKFGKLDLGFVRLPRVSSLYVGDFGVDRLLEDIGVITPPSSTTHKHLVYYDGPNPFDEFVCGTAFVPRAAATEGGRAGIAFVWLRSLCGGDVGSAGLNAAVAVHELIHGLGPLLDVVSPHECADPDDGHVCDSTADVLYPSASADTALFGQRLDVGRDDYYGHSGGWFDVQDSAWLTHLPQQRLDVTIRGTRRVGGVVRLTSPTFFECTQNCSLELDQGLAATLVATPSSGSRFVGWRGACTGKGSCSVTLEAARSVAAVFGASTFRLTVGVGGRGKLSSTPAGVSCPGRCAASFRADSSVRLRAAASPGFRFAGWTGSCRGTGACVVKLSRDRTVRATFRRK